jgi:Pyridoxamine 5'-phosphate oxidase
LVRVSVVRWDEFADACPAIAELAQSRFRADQLVMLGTIRPDGSPRISPCEVDFVDGRLMLGMMWQSHKARDLLRDPRIGVHSVPSNRDNPGGDVKLSGVAVDERDAGVRAAYREAILARIDWAPDEPNFHLFSLDVREAAFIRFGSAPIAMAWDAERGFREVPHPDAGD